MNKKQYMTEEEKEQWVKASVGKALNEIEKNLFVILETIRFLKHVIGGK